MFYVIFWGGPLLGYTTQESSLLGSIIWGWSPSCLSRRGSSRPMKRESFASSTINEFISTIWNLLPSTRIESQRKTKIERKRARKEIHRGVIINLQTLSIPNGILDGRRPRVKSKSKPINNDPTSIPSSPSHQK